MRWFKPEEQEQSCVEEAMTSLRMENDKLRKERDELIEALTSITDSTEGFNDLYDDDSRCQAYAEDLRNLSDARDRARELLKSFHLTSGRMH